MISFQNYLNATRCVCKDYENGFITESECDEILSNFDESCPEYFEAAVKISKNNTMIEEAYEDYQNDILDLEMLESVVNKLEDDTEMIYESFEVDLSNDLFFEKALTNETRSYKKIYRGWLSDAWDKIYDIRKLVEHNEFGTAIKNCAESVALVEKAKNEVLRLCKNDFEVGSSVYSSVINIISADTVSVIQFKHKLMPKSLGERLLGKDVRAELKENNKLVKQNDSDNKIDKDSTEKDAMTSLSKKLLFHVKNYKENVNKLQVVIKKLEKEAKTKINSDVE